MGAWLENLYLELPAWAQNWALYIQGLRERRIRFGKHYHMFAREVTARRHWARVQLADYQIAALTGLVATATRHVPFYHELYKQKFGNDLQITSLHDLSQLPIIDKATLRERNVDFCDRRVPARNVIRIKTTGTTGLPVTVYTTPRARQLNYAYYNDFLRTVGLNPFGKRIVLGGRTIMSAAHRHKRYWRFSRSMNTMYLSSYHISRATVSAYAQAINDWDAEYIDAYPSSMSTLAELLCDRRLRVKSPSAVITSSESLYSEQRELIEHAFGSPVYDQYGAREMCLFAAQCRSGRYHARPDYGIIEIYKDDRQAMPGEIGAVLCTGFVNPTMPLIRYSIGDMAAWAVDQRCDCGSAGPVLEQVLGRQDDAIVCPDGRRIGRLSPLLLKGFPVREAQYIQRQLDVLVVRLVKEQGYAVEHTDAIRTELRKLVGKEMAVEVEFVDAIPKGRGGKYRAVISELNH